MPKKQSSIPGYIAWKTFCRFLEKTLKPYDQLPRTIDRSLMDKLSGGDQGQVLSTLRFLRLTDADDKTGDTKLKALVDAHGTDEWAMVLREVLDTAYADIASLDAAAGSTPKELIGKFRTEGGMKEGVTVSRAISFYLKAIEEAGVEVPAALKRAPGMAKPPPKKKLLKGEKVKPIAPAEQEPIMPTTMDGMDGLHPMLSGLIQSLPRTGAIITEEERKNLEGGFAAALRLAFKTQED